MRREFELGLGPELCESDSTGPILVTSIVVLSLSQVRACMRSQGLRLR